MYENSNNHIIFILQSFSNSVQGYKSLTNQFTSSPLHNINFTPNKFLFLDDTQSLLCVPQDKKQYSPNPESKGFTDEEIKKYQGYMKLLADMGASEISSRFVQKTTDERMLDINKIAKKIELYLKSSDVPWIEPRTLSGDKYLENMYFNFIKELNDLAASMELLYFILNENTTGNSLPMAGKWTLIDVWQYVIHYSEGHSTQKWRINIANKRLESLRK